MLIKTEKRKTRNGMNDQYWQTWYFMRCEYCGKEEWYSHSKYIVKRGNISRRFCSRECWYKYTKEEEKNCWDCGIILNEENWVGIKYAYICKNCRKRHKKEQWHKLRKLVIEKYGGKCVHCGEGRIGCLVMDHVNNDGAKERRERFKNGPSGLYIWLKDNPVSSNYQILCWNCNWLKRMEGKSLSKIRKEIIEGYGGVCENCGEDNPMVLGIHHKDGGGKREREQKHHSALWVELKHEGYPRGKHSLLCLNCNNLIER